MRKRMRTSVSKRMRKRRKRTGTRMDPKQTVTAPTQKQTVKRNLPVKCTKRNSKN